ncbi:MAG: lipopolysaccharide biosynthesis protein [Acidobacteriaceae bacterium]
MANGINTTGSPGNPSLKGLPALPADSGAPRFARLAKNAMANMMRLGASWLVILIVPPILVRYLSHSEYSTWMLVIEITAYSTIFNSSMQASVSRFVARAFWAEDWAMLGETLSSITLLFVGAAVVVLGLIALVALEMGRFFHAIPGGLLGEAKWALIIVGGSLALVFPTISMAGLSLGIEKNKINAIAGAASKLVGAAGTIWAALHHDGLVRMALWTSIGIFIQPAIFWIATVRQGLWSFFSARLVRMHRAWEFCRFCAAALASQIGSILISGLDVPIVAAWDFSNTGYYAIAAMVSNMLAVPYSAVLSTLIPLLSSRTASESPETMGRMVIRTMRIANALLLWIAVPLMIGMPLLLRLWVGKEYAAHTLVLGEILAASVLIRISVLPYGITGFSAGEQNKMLVSPGVEAIVNVTLSIILVHHIGALGVAVGTLVGTFVGIALHFWNSMAYTKSMSFRKTEFLVRGMLAPLGWAMPAAIISATLFFLTSSTGLKILVLAGCTAALPLIFWKVILGDEDRSLLRLATGHLFPRLSRV